MKGIKKCFGLFLVLVTMLGLSLNASSGVSALKHQLTAMPLYNYQYILPNSSSIGAPSYFYILQPGLSIDLSNSSSPRYWNPKLYDNNSICVFNSSSTYNYNGHIPTPSDGAALDFSMHFSVYSTTSDSFHYPLSLCSSYYAFNTHGLLDTNWNFPPQIFPLLIKTKPYSAEYYSYIYRDSANKDGLIYDSHGLSLNDILYLPTDSSNVHTASSNLVSQFKNPTSMSIPIGVIHDLVKDSSDFVEIKSGTSLNFNYEIDFVDTGSVTGFTSNNFDVSVAENSNVRLHYVYAADDDNYTYHNGYVTCPVTVTPFYYEGIITSYNYSWSCDFVAPEDIYDGALGLAFELRPGSGQSSIWDVDFPDIDNAAISFYTSGIYVVTDYDETPGSSIGSSLEGSDLSRAPGSVYNQMSDSLEPNYDASLTNLFNFSLINPFAPLFSMFTDGSQCGSIPIIAGMLHAEETTYCSWFPSSVRSVLTPVLSIAGTMLLFGFFVRWLSSSSGNMFEDQTTHKWGNTQIGQQKHGKY